MTATTATLRPATGTANPGQLAVIAAAAAAVALAAAYAHAHPGAVTDPALARLLRAMAAIKILLAALAGAALLWRLATPAGAFWLTAYAAASAATAAGPVLIWTLSHIAAGALLLHGGLLATALLLWRDPATAARLETTLAARRRALKT